MRHWIFCFTLSIACALTGNLNLWATPEAKDASDTLSCPFSIPSKHTPEFQEHLNFLERLFIKKGGPQKAFTHFRNIVDHWLEPTYEVKQYPSSPMTKMNSDEFATMDERVNQLEDGQPFLRIQNRKYALISDMTQSASKRRLWLLNLDGQDTEHSIRVFYTSHGRGPKAFDPYFPGKGPNTVETMTYEGNEFDSRLTPTGLHITGSVYQGANRGPKGKDLSLILHGVEEGVNDNTTERLVVIHSKDNIYECNEGVKPEGVHIMSSGCTMVDTKVVNDIILKVRGTGGTHPDYKHEPKTGGAIYFVYGHRESQLPDSFYAQPQR